MKRKYLWWDICRNYVGASLRCYKNNCFLECVTKEVQDKNINMTSIIFYWFVLLSYDYATHLIKWAFITLGEGEDLRKSTMIKNIAFSSLSSCCVYSWSFSTVFCLWVCISSSIILPPFICNRLLKERKKTFAENWFPWLIGKS